MALNFALLFRSSQHVSRGLLPLSLRRLCFTDYSDIKRTTKIDKLLRREHLKRRFKDNFGEQRHSVDTLALNQAALRKRITRVVSKLVRRTVYSDEALCKLVEITDVRIPLSLTEISINWQLRDPSFSRGIVQTQGFLDLQEKQKIESILLVKAQEIHHKLNASPTSISIGEDATTPQNLDSQSDNETIAQEQPDFELLRMDKLKKVTFIYRDPLERVMMMERTFEALKGSSGSILDAQISLPLHDEIERSSAKKQQQVLRSTNVYDLDRDALVREIERERKKHAKSENSWRKAAAVAESRNDSKVDARPVAASHETDFVDDAKKRLRSALRNTNIQGVSRRDAADRQSRKALSPRNLIGEVSRMRLGDVDQLDQDGEDNETEGSSAVGDNEMYAASDSFDAINTDISKQQSHVSSKPIDNYEPRNKP